MIDYNHEVHCLGWNMDSVLSELPEAKARNCWYLHFLFFCDAVQTHFMSVYSWTVFIYLYIHIILKCMFVCFRLCCWWIITRNFCSKKKHESDLTAKIIHVVCTFLDIVVDDIPWYSISIRMTKFVQ